MTDQNSTAMNQFLSYKGEKFQKITLIPKEASVRNYYRVHYESSELVLSIDENFTSTTVSIFRSKGFFKTE
jgi:hypothetical protein